MARTIIVEVEGKACLNVRHLSHGSFSDLTSSAQKSQTPKLSLDLNFLEKGSRRSESGPGVIAGLSKMTVGRCLSFRYRNGYRYGEKVWCAYIRLKSNPS
jgi:hypothetical protein